MEKEKREESHFSFHSLLSSLQRSWIMRCSSSMEHIILYHNLIELSAATHDHRAFIYTEPLLRVNWTFDCAIIKTGVYDL